MDQVTELLRGADDLMDRAEALITVDFEKGQRLFREAVFHLEQAYLIAAAGRSLTNEDVSGDTAGLFEKCLQLNPDFEALRDAVDLLSATDNSAADAEFICDAVNEIWDFMYGLMEESE